MCNAARSAGAAVRWSVPLSNEEARLAAQPPAGPANARALAWSIVVHVIALGLLFVGLKWTHAEREVSVKGPIIEASLVIDPEAVQAPAPKPKPTPPKPKPQPPKPKPPEPEPVPVEPEPEPTPPPSEDRTDQEFIDEMGLLEEAEIEREQEERRRQEQIELEQEERRERRERREQEREEQIADLESDRREAEDARMEELLAQEQSESQTQPRPGNEGQDDDLLAQYALALQQAITQEWTRPDTVPLGQKCRITILQIPGGEVVGAEVDPSCPFDALGRRSIEAAVMKATPLPYQGFEDVFDRRLNITFTARDRY